MSISHNPPIIIRAALEAFEHQNGSPDISRFLVESGRVIVTDAAGQSRPVTAVEGRAVHESTAQLESRDLAVPQAEGIRLKSVFKQVDGIGDHGEPDKIAQEIEHNDLSH